MLEAKNIIRTSKGKIRFDLFIENNRSEQPDVKVLYDPDHGTIAVDRTLDYSRKNYVIKAIRKLKSFAPNYPNCFRMVWY